MILGKNKPRGVITELWLWIQVLNKMLQKAGNEGSSTGEVFLITFFVPISSLLVLSICRLLFSVWLTEYVEVIFLNLVLLLVLTVFCNSLSALSIAMGLLLFLSLYVLSYKVSKKNMIDTLKSVTLRNIQVKDFSRIFVGDYRGHLLLATSICILAVDFHIFPSRFAKTETYGWSVMDAGVGSFVFLHGLCSSLGNQHYSFQKCFYSSFPLFVLGFLRLGVTTAVGYHKVVPEYGRHWNFFFTLALTKIVCVSILRTVHTNVGLLAIITMISHQVLLSKFGLSDLVLSSARENLIQANKEGICSLLGFVSLYFFGCKMRHFLFKERTNLREYTDLLFELCGIGIVGWLLTFIFHENIQQTSRRMANISYIIWVVTLTSLQIAVHLLYRILTAIINHVLRVEFCGSLLWNVINHNGLFYFLLANVLTGFVNITINTNDASSLKSLCILFVYLSVLFLSSFILYKLQLRKLQKPVDADKCH